MSEVKRKWHTIGIPDSIFLRVEKVAYLLGYQSLSEYVRNATLDKLRTDEPIVEEKEDERLHTWSHDKSRKVEFKREE